MGRDYSGRFPKDSQSRRQRKFHSPFSSYSSNPNPFPPQQPQQPHVQPSSQQPQAPKQPMFSSHRSDDQWYPRRGGFRGRAGPDRGRNSNFGSSGYNNNSSSSGSKRFQPYDYRRPLNEHRYSHNGPKFHNGHQQTKDESRSNSLNDQRQQNHYDYSEYDKSVKSEAAVDAPTKDEVKDSREASSDSKYEPNVSKEEVAAVADGEVNGQDETLEVDNGNTTIYHTAAEEEEEEEEEAEEDEAEEEDDPVEEANSTRIKHDDAVPKELPDDSATVEEDVEMTDIVPNEETIIQTNETTVIHNEGDSEFHQEEPQEPILKNELMDKASVPVIFNDDELKSVAQSESNINYSSVQSCIFPMREFELIAWELHHKELPDLRNVLKHLNIDNNDFNQYSNLLNSELLIFQQADVFNMHKLFTQVDKLVEQKVNRLTNEWVYRSKLWKADISFYDRQLKDYYQNSNDESREFKKPLDESNEKPKTSTGRRNRHGDSVRTEAEFMEILKSLEQERERDPLVRAQYGAATIPNMILDPLEKYQFESFVDFNNLKTDKELWAERLLTDPVDNFTPVEHQNFIQAYLMYPKRFGKISQTMGGLRSSEECVLHYYRTKKETNYKQLIINKNKKNKKSKNPVGRKPKKLKAGMKGITPAAASESEFDVPTTPDQEVFLETRKVKTGITVPVKPRVVSETISGNDQESPEDVVTANESQSEVKEEIEEDKVDTAAVAIAIASQTLVSNNAEGSTENFHPPPTELHEEKKRKKRRTEEGHSSYWSVQEINKFPLLLQTYGSDWEEISKVLKTKTPAMSRNYYQRSLNDHPEWRTFVINGDANKLNASQQPQPQPQPQQPIGELNKDDASGPPVGLFYKKPSSYTSVPTEHPNQQINEALPYISTNGTTLPNMLPSLLPHSSVSQPSAPQFNNPVLIPVKIEKDLPKPPMVRSSIRSLLNSDDIRSPSPPPSLLPSANIMEPSSLQHPIGYPNLVNGVSGINGLAAVAGLYAQPNVSASVVKEQYKSIILNQPVQQASAPSINNLVPIQQLQQQSHQPQQPQALTQVPLHPPTAQHENIVKKENNMSALNALAKVAFEQT